MSDPSPRAPELAVIVAAYRRREYVRGALDSVLAQTLPAGSLEVLVQTDFEDVELDRHCAEVGAAHRVDAEPVIGRFLLHAIDATHAPLIAIVDDDDLVEPERFARALDRFHRTPATTLYRNRVSVIDPVGRPVPVDRYSRLERAAGYDRTGPIEIGPGDRAPGLARLRASQGEFFNISSMVFRREIFTPLVRPEVERAICQDLFTFVAAATMPGSMYFDDARLTRYRHHPTSASRLKTWRRLHWQDHLRFAAFARVHGPPALADWLDERARMLGCVAEAGELLDPIRSGAAPRETLGAVRRYLGRRIREPVLQPPTLVRWGSGAAATAYALAPGLSRRFLARVGTRLDLP
ncbi:MAG: glycosyltransferase family 2 protein [Thermoplasmata archaeon]